MSDCNKIESLMERALYHELTPTESEFFDRHTASCPECAKDFEEYKSIVTACASEPRPGADSAFMNAFWETLAPKIEKKKSPAMRWWSDLVNAFRFESMWKYQLAGGLAILLFGVMIGDFLSRKENVLEQNVPPEIAAAQTASEIEALQYIQRSKVLLLGLMNFDPATDDVETINLERQKKISGELLTKAAEIKTVLREPSQQQLKKLVSDIELILLQIANLDAKYDLTGIEIIREGVKSKGIILKIHIQEMKKEEKKLAPENTGAMNDTKTI